MKKKLQWTSDVREIEKRLVIAGSIIWDSSDLEAPQIRQAKNKKRLKNLKHT